MRGGVVMAEEGGGEGSDCSLLRRSQNVACWLRIDGRPRNSSTHSPHPLPGTWPDPGLAHVSSGALDKKNCRFSTPKATQDPPKPTQGPLQALRQSRANRETNSRLAAYPPIVASLVPPTQSRRSFAPYLFLPRKQSGMSVHHLHQIDPV